MAMNLFNFSSISVKPYFLSDPEDVTALTGEDVRLKCDVHGDPEPSVVWHREDGQLPDTFRASINKGHLLHISSVSPSDEGVYICEARNSVGAVSSSVSLSVHGKRIDLVVYFSHEIIYINNSKTKLAYHKKTYNFLFRTSNIH